MMTRTILTVDLVALKTEEHEEFIKANQESFNYGALEEFGPRHTYFEEEGQVIARNTILRSLQHGQAYWIILDGRRVGGLILMIEGERGELETLFTTPTIHSKGIGFAAWIAVEQTFPQVKIWETVTPYYDQRNIHFYVNRCGFHVVEYYNRFHQEPIPGEENHNMLEQFPEGFFRFEKQMQ
ncbi:GNAT family N-acetyltransferase [Streptococcus ruminantium]|uniref:GNAT family N-acetyltransferase n=2 Tax=Streptococcus TaxID=1301 RepID=UPI001D1472E7|nr:GNAT family N-acetyltransferase [Streptococcus ruminantium]